MLISEDEYIRRDAWLIVEDLINKGIISKEDASSKKEYLN